MEAICRLGIDRSNRSELGRALVSHPGSSPGRVAGVLVLDERDRPECGIGAAATYRPAQALNRPKALESARATRPRRNAPAQGLGIAVKLFEGGAVLRVPVGVDRVSVTVRALTLLARRRCDVTVSAR